MFYLLVIMSLYKETYHKRSTYDELVVETITNPTDVIGLPNREATTIRSDPRMTKLDDEGFLTLDDENKKIQAAIFKQQTLRTQLSNNTKNTMIIRLTIIQVTMITPLTEQQIIMITEKQLITLIIAIKIIIQIILRTNTSLIQFSK